MFNNGDNMKMKIIIGCMLAAFLMTMLPSIQAVEYDTAVDTKEEWIEENVASIKGILGDSEAPEGIITTILMWLVRILLMPLKLAFKITMILVKIICKITWKLVLLPIKLLLLILPPYNKCPC
jgi:hypothetical protein